jgi:hypothetical protein
MKTHHKWLIAIGLLATVLAWFAWTLLTAESDIGPQGRLNGVGQPRALRPASFRSGRSGEAVCGITMATYSQVPGIRSQVPG